ncbi:hypothetical protein ACVWYT_008593 [Streptomyces sp. TE4109]
MHAFNQHPDQPFRVRERHGYGLLTGGPDMNVSRNRLGRQDFLTRPGPGHY